MVINDEEHNQSEQDINLEDVEFWQWSIIDNTRISLVQQDASISNADFVKVRYLRVRSGSLLASGLFEYCQTNENVLRSLLVYCPFKKAVYCFCRRLFADKIISEFEFQNQYQYQNMNLAHHMFDFLPNERNWRLDYEANQ